jgi:hypothetical protein
MRFSAKLTIQCECYALVVCRGNTSFLSYVYNMNCLFVYFSTIRFELRTRLQSIVFRLMAETISCPTWLNLLDALNA